jgi:nicotinamide riboside kinase
MSPVRRINLMAGPGAGKSTLAARIFSDLKTKQYDIEHVSEYVKNWAYEDRKPQSFDQLYIFSKQLKSEESVLRKVKYLVTDSPIFLNAAFCVYYGCKYSKELLSIASLFEEKYPSINLLIERSVDYVTKGRYQTLDEAKDFDLLLSRILDQHLSKPVISVKIDDLPRILSILEKEIND